jgi:uncharacterized protein
MSDTTPRPDETPGQPGPPPPPPGYAPPPPPQGYAQPPADPASGPYPAQQPPPPAYGAPAPGYEVAPTAMSPSDERTWGMAAHGITLAATVVTGGGLGFVAALVTYLVVRDRGPFVRHHSANALNVQIIAGIVMLVSLPLMLMLVGFVTFAAAWVFAVVVHIIGAVKANNGEWYDPPMTPKFVK